MPSKEEVMYIINTDSSIEPHNPGGVLTWGFIVKSMVPPKGEVHRAAGISGWGEDTTNNVGEYHGVMAAMLWALEELPEDKRRPLLIQSDSQLIVNQCSGTWQVKDERLQRLHGLVMNAVAKYGMSVKFKWIPRTKNFEADDLSRTAYADIQDVLEEMRQLKKNKEVDDDDLSW